MVKPPFCRVGRKTPLRPILLRRIPEHKTYVEPFVGTGDLFFNKPPAERSVLNDLDSEVIKGFRLLKTASEDISKYNFPTSVEAANRFVKSSPSTTEGKLIKHSLMSCGTFGGKGSGKIYKVRDETKTIKRLPKYKELLENTTLLSQDYKSVLSRYDSPSTFFYLDPPYEKSEKLYKEGSVDLEDMANRVKKLKGKVLISLNDSKRVRDAFKGLNIRGISVVGGGHNVKRSGIGSATRKEVLISNY